jgi:hypothetical protein
MRLLHFFQMKNQETSLQSQIKVLFFDGAKCCLTIPSSAQLASI